MLFIFLITHVIALTIANPFHKYPYVFLLDIGNEELAKTNSEQLRVSIPGGSLAMKYPVAGEGNTITHVRVSGIDFGTDLKANIVDGGPGYKYVVIVFMGNPGVSYDAVITLETLENEADANVVNNVINEHDADSKVNENNDSSYEVSEDVGESDGDDDTKDSTLAMKVYSEKSNAEVMQSSSTFYNYAKNEMSSNDDGDDDGEDDGNDDESENNSAEEVDDSSDEEDSVSKEETSDESEDSSEVKEDIGIENQGNDGPKALPYTSNSGDSYAMDEDKPADIVDDSLYEKYQDLKPHFSDGFRIYPQSNYEEQYQSNSVYDSEDGAEFEQMFNDEEVHNDAGKFKDWNNNADSQYLAAEY